MTAPHVLEQHNGRSWVGGVVHAHTTMSDGQRSADELVAFAHSRGLGAVCVTDHHFDSWRYRFGVRVSRSSAQRFGIANYLAEIRQVACAGLGPLVLPGIEVMPHYRWEGLPPFLRCQAMKTGVVYGIDDASVLNGMPMHLDGRGRDEAQARHAAQMLIDYIRAHNGLFFWSHLEEDEQVRFFTASIRYRPRPDLLALSHGYSGFGCFPHGDRLGCEPGGAWDQRLALASRSGRYDGPWVTGESDYHRGDSLQPYENISNPVTVFLLDALQPSAVLAALRTGRMYAYQGPSFRTSLLHRFEIRSERGDTSAQAGGVLRGDAKPRLVIQVSGFVDGCRVRVVCGGRVFAEHEGRAMNLALPAPEGHGYACRAEITSPVGEKIMTNPVFVVASGERETT